MRKALPWIAVLLLSACGGGGDGGELVACGPHGECPSGQTCNASDHNCYATGSAGIDARPASIDAAPVNDAEVAPPTAIDLPLPDTTTGPTVEVRFSATGSGITFECRLDGGAWQPCSSPTTYDALAGGPHQIGVRAVTATGMRGPEATRSFTVDATGPMTTIGGTPANGASTRAPDTDLTLTASVADATFECGMDAAAFAPCQSPVRATGLAEGKHTFAARATAHGVTGGAAQIAWTIDVTPPAVTLTDQPGSLTNATTASEGATRCQLDGAAAAPCTSPVSYPGLGDGRHIFAVMATDSAGNEADATYAWTINTAAPPVSITAHPPSLTRATDATFAFTAAGVIRCRLDGGAPAPCDATIIYTGLGEGSHTFTVQAADVAGNVGSATYAWRIDLTPPTVTLTATPVSPTSARVATFTFAASEGTTRCQLDGGAFVDCSSPAGYTNLDEGEHTVVIEATDGAGNAGGATYRWTVDVTPPAVAITGHPPDPTNMQSATFPFTVAEGSPRCRLDGGAFAPCTSPAHYDGLADGSHTFTVEAADAAGNVGTAGFTWMVSTGAPTVTITAKPPSVTNSTGASFAFTAGAGALSCQLDDGAPAACSSPKSYAGLAPGPHGFTVQATDAAGNVGSASYTWTIDVTPPVVTLTGKPADPSNAAAGSFSFTVSEGSPMCRLDGAAFAACSSPTPYSGLADGAHTFAVQATDAAGNTGVATYGWVVDTAAPTVTLTQTPPNPSSSRSATFAFTAAAGTVECSLDAGAYAACGSPQSYSGLGDASHTFTVRVTDAAGNVGTASYPWTVDGTAPTVGITATPANPTNQTTATFSFTVNEGATQCKLDGGAVAACTSPKTYSGLAAGPHTFVVTATDAAGNAGSATFPWTIDVTGPTVTITSHPTTPTNQTSATFAFTASEGSPQCKLDGGAAAACTSPKTYSGLAAGSHAFTVSASDAAGNPGSASFPWTVDLSGPTVAINTHPTTPTNQTSATFTFTASEGSPQCKLDSGAAAACVSPKTYSALAAGAHTFTVSATDAAGNPASASFPWTIDLTPPTVTIDTHPTTPTNQTSATFTFTASEGSPQCKLDSGAAAACVSPKTYSALAAGAHTFTVSATDAAGNPASASFPWTIDLSGPTVTINTHPTTPTNQTSATFTFTASEGSPQCKLDAAAAAACTSPKTYSALAAGAHTFVVSTTDAAGNLASASFPWTVDLTPPTVTIDTHPPTLTNQTSATFTFTASEGSPQCKLDGGAAAACTSPKTYSGVAAGSHTLVVSTTDAAGNPASASFTWTIDVTPPVVTFTNIQRNPTTGSAVFTFTVSDGSVVCYFEGQPINLPCVSPFGIAQGPGLHHFEVRATDAATNVGSAQATFVGDTYVDAINGTDAASGLPGFPFKTIKRALAFAAATATIHCAPGTYDEANGETFPIILPAGVILEGDTANRGTPRNGTWTRIIGSGGLFGPQRLTLYPGEGSTITGFEIIGTGTLPNAALYVATANVSITFNTIEGGVGDGIDAVGSGAIHLYVADNTISLNAGSGLYVDHALVGAERNHIAGNDVYGVGMVGTVVDLGSGSEGMIGNNTIICNVVADVYSNVGGGAVVHAWANLWEHGSVQNSTVCGNGVNFCSPAGDTIDAANPHASVDSCGP